MQIGNERNSKLLPAAVMLLGGAVILNVYLERKKPTSGDIADFSQRSIASFDPQAGFGPPCGSGRFRDWIYQRGRWDLCGRRHGTDTMVLIRGPITHRLKAAEQQLSRVNHRIEELQAMLNSQDRQLMAQLDEAHHISNLLCRMTWPISGHSATIARWGKTRFVMGGRGAAQEEIAAIRAAMSSVVRELSECTRKRLDLYFHRHRLISRLATMSSRRNHRKTWKSRIP